MIRMFLGVILGIYWDLWGESLGFIGRIIGIYRENHWDFLDNE